MPGDTGLLGRVGGGGWVLEITRRMRIELIFALFVTHMTS